MLEFIKRKTRGFTAPSLHVHYEEELLLNEDNEGNDDAPRDEPVDQYHLVYMVFFLYGIAMLLPWNVFITASEYFAGRFKGSSHQEDFQSYFSTYFTVTNMVVFVYVLWRQSANVIFPVVVNAIIFGIMAISVGTSWDGSDYFWLTLILMALTGATTSFFQVAVFAQASRFPPHYVQAVMSGQGIAGVSVAASSILSSLTGTIRIEEDETSDRSALMYFLTALIVTVAALVGHVILAQQPFYIHHIKQQQDKTGDDDEDTVDRPRPLRRLAEKSSCLLFTVAFVFVVTLMIFPSITSMIKSIHRHPSASRFFDDDIFVAMHFLIFNIGDWVGRILPLYISTFNPSVLLVFAGLRVLFIPLFLVCNVVAAERNMPLLIRSDGAYFVLLGLFSVTSGWICSLTMMAAPQQPFLRSSAEKSLVGSLMSFSLVVGLAIGGSLSFWTRSMV